MATQEHFDTKLAVCRQGRHDDALVEVVAVRESNHLSQVRLKLSKKRHVKDVGMMTNAGKPREFGGAPMVDATFDTDADRREVNARWHQGKERSCIETA
jgi:hypothetical protein